VARPLNEFCKVKFLSSIVRHLKVEKERSQQHELIGMVMRVFNMYFMFGKIAQFAAMFLKYIS